MSLALTLTGGTALGHHGPLSLSAGRFGGEGRQVNATGYLLLPGIVDAHGDRFERHMAPRRGAVRDLATALTYVEAELAASGITTAHLAQFYSWEGGMRGPAFAWALAEALGRFEAQLTLALQLRVETHLLDAYADIEALITKHAIGHVVFNDHLPHDALAKGKRPPRLTGQALKSGRSPEAHEALLQSLHANGPEVPGALDALCAKLTACGIRIGSHDDHTPEDRHIWHARGAALAEFPETLEAAEATRAQGGQIIMGAPNLIRGASHKGNIAAQTLIEAGLCDALASDYHYPAPAQAAFQLAASGTLPLAEAWALISERPARMLGYEDRGTLTEDQRADLLVVNATTKRIEATFAAGRLVHLTGAFAERLLG